MLQDRLLTMIGSKNLGVLNQSASLLKHSVLVTQPDLRTHGLAHFVAHST